MSDDITPGLIWRQLHWQRPLDPARAAACLRQWAADGRSQHIVLEARGSQGNVTYLLGTTPSAVRPVGKALQPLLTALTPIPDTTRTAVPVAGRLKFSTRHRPLRTNDPASIVRALVSALALAGEDEELVLQVVLGPRRVPLAIPDGSPSSVVAPWWEVAWRGDGGRLDGEKRAALRSKVGDHGFACTIRLGVRAPAARRRGLILGILAAIRTSEAPGLQIRLVPERAGQLNGAAQPWWWPLRLGVPELCLLTGWPLGDDDLPGQPAPHPRRLPPAPGTAGRARVLARASAPGHDALLTLPVREALQHLHVIGPTGTGKSTALAALISQDLRDGHGVVVVEPKGDLVEAVLGRVSVPRQDDVVVLDPSDEAPVGLNPLAAHGRRPELVADGVLTILKQLYGAAIGPRSQDILYAGLLTLAHRGDASLVMLPLLLTNPGFRRTMTAGLRDPLTLEPFWAAFDNWSEAERATAIAPVMNKLRPLLRPGLRGVLGQREPRFALRQVFTERKALFVPLRRGVIGADAAGLVGSFVIAELWQAAQARSAVAADRRHPIMVYVDEVQDYLHLPTDLGDALAQARGYGVGFTLAHQFLDQLPRDMRTAVLANARSRLCFQLPHEDAVVFAKGHPEVTSEDFTTLGRYEVYASLFADGRASPYASGTTLPLAEPTSAPDELRRRSRERYGRPLDEVEQGFVELATNQSGELGTTGRRRRQS